MRKKHTAQVYPTITLKKAVVFPEERIPLVMEGEDVAFAVARAHRGDHKLVFLFEENGRKSRTGVLSDAKEHWDLAPAITGLMVEGVRRVKVKKEFAEGKVQLAEVEDFPMGKVNNDQEIEALSRSAVEQFKKIIQVEGTVPLGIIEDLQRDFLEPVKVVSLIASSLRLSFQQKLELLEAANIQKQLELINQKLRNELNIAKTEQKIRTEVEKDVGQAQKEFILRERLKAIEKELGISQEQKEYEILEEKLKAAGLSAESGVKVMGEFQRLRQMPPGSPELSYLRTYLEWIADLPWSRRSEEVMNIQIARETLDADHYGLEKAKERVLEYLAVQKLTGGKTRGNILCFVGPPGTGKTSVGQSIAKALGRKFVRISLGGIRDEAEIRGHRRTYVGALPGRIIQGMKNAGVKNPIFMMDEVDKIGADFRGDPSAALLEALDPAQNNSFSDHYIEIPFDLSEVFFITTANILDPIPPALRDRMEVIEFPGYTEEEKFQIAKKFLFPRVLTGTGLNHGELTVSDAATHQIINHYTKEAGVRELERKLLEIARKVALAEAEGKQKRPVEVTEKNLHKYLGPEEFEITTKEQQDEVGVATGLAWTPAGGEVIFIESALVPGKGELTLTGQLGQVMQESAKAALTYVRSRAKDLDFKNDFYHHSDIHVHVPEGAIPKDGPSSGIAIATSLASMLTKRKIKKEIALSGEVTLSGKVLKVGGIKEKVLAAHRGGAKVVILPAGNKKNLVDVPKEIKKDLDFKFVRHMDEVLKQALI